MLSDRPVQRAARESEGNLLMKPDDVCKNTEHGRSGCSCAISAR